MAHKDFDPDIKRLADGHENAERGMLQAIIGMLRGSTTFRAAEAILDAIADTLGLASEQWTADVVPRIYADGMRTAQDALGATVDPTPHNVPLELLRQDLMDDLAALTEQMSRDAKAKLRQIARRQASQMMATGSNAIPQAREMEKEMVKEGVAFTDRGGRRWKPRAYSELVLRTKAVEVSNEANVNTARQLGSAAMRIFDGGPGDVDEPCRVANGQVWSAEFFAAHLLEHPHCRRAGTPLPSTYAGKVDRE